jgi:hypothetical protein
MFVHLSLGLGLTLLMSQIIDEAGDSQLGVLSYQPIFTCGSVWIVLCKCLLLWGYRDKALLLVPLSSSLATDTWFLNGAITTMYPNIGSACL